MTATCRCGARVETIEIATLGRRSTQEFTTRWLDPCRCPRCPGCRAVLDDDRCASMDCWHYGLVVPDPVLEALWD